MYVLCCCNNVAIKRNQHKTVSTCSKSVVSPELPTPCCRRCRLSCSLCTLSTLVSNNARCCHVGSRGPSCRDKSTESHTDSAPPQCSVLGSYRVNSLASQYVSISDSGVLTVAVGCFLQQANDFVSIADPPEVPAWSAVLSICPPFCGRSQQTRQTFL